MNQNINPKSPKGKDLFNRTLELMNKLTPINESVINASLEFVKRGPDKLTYTIIRENHKYFIKTTKEKKFKVSDLEYIGGLQNKLSESYPSYEEALKHLNMKFQQLNEMYGIKKGFNIFESDLVDIEEIIDEEEGTKEKKYKLKVPKDDAGAESSPEPSPEEIPNYGDETETPSVEDVPLSPEEMGGEEEMPSDSEETGGEEEMPSDSEEMGGEEDIDVDIDLEDEEDPKKYIQKLTGVLGQKMRELPEIDTKLEKYVINSIISALHVDKMDKKDRIDIVKKFKKKKGMESIMKEVFDMDEYYSNRSIDGPHNFEKMGEEIHSKRQKNIPLKFKKYELGMDKDEQWQAAAARIAVPAISSYIGSKLGGNDENMDEKLFGKQKKLDINKNNKLDAEDFRMLRSKKRRPSDEKFGAYDDSKFNDYKNIRFNQDPDVETPPKPKEPLPDIDPDTKPYTPPKPRVPDPWNPPKPKTMPGTKMKKEI